MSAEDYVNFFKERSLVHGLSDDELVYVTSRLTKEEYLPNDVIIEEGEKSTDLYIIFEGKVSVQKWDEDHRFLLPLGVLNAGEIFGEMSFMDASPRSSTIKALEKTTILKLSRRSLESGSIDARDLQNIENKIFSNIALVNINRVRTSDKVFVNNLDKQLKSFQIRQDSGKLLLYQIVLLSLGFILSIFFAEGRGYVPWIVAMIPSILMIKFSEYNWKRLGVNEEGWLSISLISMIVAACTLAVIYFMHLVFHAAPVMAWLETETLKEFTKPLLTPFWENCLLYIFYCFSIEFIARGVIQSSLQEFLDDYNGYISILIMACLVLLFQFPNDFLSVCFYLSTSLFLGFIRLIQKTILGAFIIHFIVGVLVNQILSK